VPEDLKVKRIEAVIASTNVDSHGERMSVEALEAIVESTKRTYIPVGSEHDPRIPPLGRIASAFIRERSDGEHEAVATMELFDGEDRAQVGDDARELLIRKHDMQGLSVSYDWTHRFAQDQADIAEIAAVFKTQAIREVKKSAVPISIIVIVGKFVLGSIAAGFFGQVGADGWNMVKSKLKAIVSRQQNRSSEQLLVFKVVTNIGGKDIEIETILTNPTHDDIDQFLASGLQAVDTLASTLIHGQEDTRKVVMEAKGAAVTPSFIVLKDCTSMIISVEDKVEDAEN
jgi:hypothetical protein